MESILCKICYREFTPAPSFNPSVDDEETYTCPDCQTDLGRKETFEFDDDSDLE